MDQALLIVGGGYPQLPLIEAARTEGIYTIVADDREDAPGASLAHRVLPINRYDAEGLLEVSRKLELRGVVSGGSDRSVWIAAKIAEKYGLLTYVSSTIAQLSMEKGLLRQMYRDWGVPSPQSLEAADIAEAREAVERLGFPIVVKPVDGIGQAGVNRVDSSQELDSAVAIALDCTKEHRVVIEKFLVGRELGVNGFVTAGEFHLLTIGERIAEKNPGSSFGVALRKRVPAEMSQSQQSEVKNVLQYAITKTGIRLGPIYSQIMLTSSGSYIIEMMPRLGGGEDARLVQAVTGYNLALNVVRTALGADIDEPMGSHIQSGRTVVIEFLTANPGRIVEIRGLEDARMIGGIVDARIYYGIGSSVTEIRSSHDRLGFVMAVGGNSAEAEQRLAEAKSRITIRTR